MYKEILNDAKFKDFFLLKIEDNSTLKIICCDS